MPSRHLVENRPEREQIGALVELLPARLLRRHVCHSPDSRPGSGQLLSLDGRGIEPLTGGCRGLALERQLCQTKIHELRLATPCDEDIGRLDIAMDDLLGVSGVERIGELGTELQHFRSPERPSGQPLLNRLAIDHFDHGEGLPLVLPDIEQGADVWMIQL